MKILDFFLDFLKIVSEYLQPDLKLIRTIFNIFHKNNSGNKSYYDD